MISAKIIADSTCENGSRLTTFEVVIPKYLVAEFNTHRMLSRNSASSRAIPVKTMIESITNSPAMPVWWGASQPGMQADNQIPDKDIESAKALWLEARDSAINYAQKLLEMGLHKQITNRLLETWMETKIVTTATNWGNFFLLRNHNDAQPEIHEAARQMQELYNSNTPKFLNSGEWHLPYCDFENDFTLEELKKVSASLCAQVSYRKADFSLDKAIKVYDRLVESFPPHFSPFEHQGSPAAESNFVSGNFRGWYQLRQDIEIKLKR